MAQFQFDFGVLGGGQLGRMLIMAAQRMGMSCLSYDYEDSPASQVAPALVGSLSDPESMSALFAQCARVTIENEFIPAKVIQRAISGAGRTPDCLVPSLESLAIVQDKLLQRQAYSKSNVPSPIACAIEDDGALAVAKIGFPMVLKARFGGYDGKGTRYARNADEFETHRTIWENGGWMAEQMIDFKRELAVMVFSNPAGIGCFPTMVTEQVQHVCDIVYPCEDVDASEVAISAVKSVGGQGIVGVELFESKDGRILVNEVAPRPHNSGHYSLDWGGVSQFEQHVRIVMGLPPAPIDGLGTCMVNLLGIERAGHYSAGMRAAMEGDPGIFVHWYGKSESRPGRKMGHINVTGIDAVTRAKAARNRFYKAWEVAPSFSR